MIIKKFLQTRWGCSLVVRIPRCGRGDLGSNPSSHTSTSFKPNDFFLRFYSCPMALPNFHRTSRKELFPNDKTLNPSLLCNDLDVNLHSSHSSLSLRVPLPVDHSVLSALDTSQTPPPDPLVSQPGIASNYSF